KSATSASMMVRNPKRADLPSSLAMLCPSVFVDRLRAAMPMSGNATFHKIDYVFGHVGCQIGDAFEMAGDIKHPDQGVGVFGPRTQRVAHGPRTLRIESSTATTARRGRPSAACSPPATRSCSITIACFAKN